MLLKPVSITDPLTNQLHNYLVGKHFYPSKNIALLQKLDQSIYLAVSIQIQILKLPCA